MKRKTYSLYKAIKATIASVKMQPETGLRAILLYGHCSEPCPASIKNLMSKFYLTSTSLHIVVELHRLDSHFPSNNDAIFRDVIVLDMIRSCRPTAFTDSQLLDNEPGFDRLTY